MTLNHHQLGLSLRYSALVFGVCEKTVRRWLARAKAAGFPPRLEDHSSVPHRQPRKTSPQLEAQILALRRQRRSYAQVLMVLPVSKATRSRGKEFWFFLRQGPYAFGESASRDGLYVGYMSGHIPESARAKFDGWTEQDFWLLLERAIRDAFRWDPESGRLVAKDPEQFDSPSQATSFGPNAAKRLLRRAESVLKREHSYMQPRKT